MNTPAVAEAAPEVRPVVPVPQPGPVPGPLVPGPLRPLLQNTPAYPEGTLLRASGPEVNMIQGHERRRIDLATLNYLGLNRSTIQTIPDNTWNAIPVGPSFPSMTDGTILRGNVGSPFEYPDPRVWVMLGGQKHLIPDRVTFESLGLDWSAIQTVSYDDLNAIPLGAPIPEGSAAHPWFPIVASQDNDFSGSGGHMHSDVTIFSDGLLNAVTHTWEVTDLRGFIGGVSVTLLDQNSRGLWASAVQQYGVDGRWIGTSDRTDNWSDHVPPEVLPNIRAISIVQNWDKKVFEDIKKWIDGLIGIVEEVADCIQKVKTALGL